MAEQLYTIPVNDAFHADCECPLCQMQKTLEEHAIEYTMGPSYMEDDNRAMTDKMGFCSHHIGIIFGDFMVLYEIRRLRGNIIISVPSSWQVC